MPRLPRALLVGAALVVAAYGVPAASAAHGCQLRETWTPTAVDEFRLPSGLFRSQGLTLAKDGSWFFSWQGGLQHARVYQVAGTTQYLEQMAVPVAIPPDLAATDGDDHTGDIDVYGEQLIAPIEDSMAYAHPWLVFYSQQTLLPTGERYELPLTMLTAGVPWVAVDAAHGWAIVAEWDNTKVLNFLDIAHGMKLHHQLRLDQVVGRIQGAKLWQGNLYASRDDKEKSVVRIDLRTGHVTPLFAQHLAGEQEGIAMGDTPDGQMHVLFIAGNTDDANGLTQLRATIHHFRRTAVSAC